MLGLDHDDGDGAPTVRQHRWARRYLDPDRRGRPEQRAEKRIGGPRPGKGRTDATPLAAVGVYVTRSYAMDLRILCQGSDVSIAGSGVRRTSSSPGSGSREDRASRPLSARCEALHVRVGARAPFQEGWRARGTSPCHFHGRRIQGPERRCVRPRGLQNVLQRPTDSGRVPEVGPSPTRGRRISRREQRSQASPDAGSEIGHGRT